MNVSEPSEVTSADTVYVIDAVLSVTVKFPVNDASAISEFETPVIV